ncbi:P-loop containing nucleoside triphosphate hydrolase protein [Xylariaceae sp. AK1471]|nr:P-loop containing nucleoside triphosphate hydrolase protein [Xylariaceae sp. AK1471]
MDTQNRLSAPLPRKIQAPIITFFSRTLFNTIHSWIAFIREISSKIATFFNAGKTPQPLIIFILGPPGAGEGTQSIFLKTAFPSLAHLSYGDLMRYEDRIPGSWVSTLPRRSGSANPIVPADAAVQLMRRTIDAGVQRGQLTWLLDGFPRNEAHVKAWAAQMPVAQCTLYLSCPRDILIQLLSLVQERVGRNINEREALLSALAKYGMCAVEIDATQNAEDIRHNVHTVYREAFNAWKLEQEL